MNRNDLKNELLLAKP